MFLLHLLRIRSMCISFIYLVKCTPPKKTTQSFPHFPPSNAPHQRKSIFKVCLRPVCCVFVFFWGKSIQRLHVSLTLHLVLMINTIYAESLYWLPWKHQEHQIPWNFVTWPMENSMVGWKIPLFWSKGDLFHQQFQWTIFIDLHGVYFMIW